MSYLEETLHMALPGLRVAAISRRSGRDEYQLKSFEKEVVDLVCAFAPQANADKIGKQLMREELDVLIVTDAYSAGMNLQDAGTVMHYDLAWTPDVLLQRAGRILRPWREPRIAHLYIFLGRFVSGSQRHQSTLHIEKRLARLTERGRQASRFAALPVMPEQDSSHFTRLGSLADIGEEYLGLADIGELEEFDDISPLLRHYTELRNSQTFAEGLPDDMTSALGYSGDTSRLYLLLRRQGKFHWRLYDLAEMRFVACSEDRLLNLIACHKDTPVADVRADAIESAAQQVRKLWLQRESLSQFDDVERICALKLTCLQVADGSAQATKQGTASPLQTEEGREAHPAV